MRLNPLLSELIPPEGLILVTGDIGSGKSCLAYAILEDMYHKYKKPAYTFNFPKPDLLPKWITNITDPELPEDSIVVLDEAYISYHSRVSMKEESRFIDKFTGLVRQKGILAIFVTQMTRKLDRGIVGSSQGFFIKRLTRMNVRLDRSELKPIFESAYRAFDKIVKEGKVDPRKCTYVLAGDFEGMIKYSNMTPSFWTENFSRAWKGIKLSESKISIKSNKLNIFSAQSELMKNSGQRLPRWLERMMGLPDSWAPKYD